KVVCYAEEDRKSDAQDEVDSLMNKSLVRTYQEARAEPRIGMLETIREYAVERLEASAEAQAVRQQHMQCFLALAEQAEPEIIGQDPEKWLSRLEAERGNLLAAVDWTVKS